MDGGDQVKGIFRISQIIFCTAGGSTDSNQLKPTSSIHGWSMGSLYDSHSLLCISLLHHHRLVVGILLLPSGSMGNELLSMNMECKRCPSRRKGALLRTGKEYSVCGIGLVRVVLLLKIIVPVL